jgi:hypothetical protein
MLMIDVRDYLAEGRREAREERKIIAALVDATRRGDRGALAEHVGKIDHLYFGWRRVFQRLARLHRIKPDMRDAWLTIYVHYGDHIRLEVGKDLLLIRALRVLLPPYRGRAVTLYRGETFWNRCQRTYGVSWTNERDVAEGFANGYIPVSKGGSVLLQTRALPAAIICAPHRLNNRYGENEYLVDRPRLGRVTVLRRFSQLNHEEACKLQGTESSSLSRTMSRIRVDAERLHSNFSGRRLEEIFTSRTVCLTEPPSATRRVLGRSP